MRKSYAVRAEARDHPQVYPALHHRSRGRSPCMGRTASRPFREDFRMFVESPRPAGREIPCHVLEQMLRGTDAWLIVLPRFLSNPLPSEGATTPARPRPARASATSSDVWGMYAPRSSPRRHEN